MDGFRYNIYIWIMIIGRIMEVSFRMKHRSDSLPVLVLAVVVPATRRCHCVQMLGR